jgi:hypothetical protein
MSEKGWSVIDSTRCINKAILCSWSSDVNHIGEQVVNSVDGQIKNKRRLHSV